MKKIIFVLIFVSFFNGLIFSQEKENADIFWSAFSSLKKNEKPKVGLAFSGGGARGFAHVGVIETIKNASFPIDYVAGTSMGAIVGAFYAADFEMDEMWRFGYEIDKYKVGKDFSGMKLIKILLSDKLGDPFYIRKFADDKFSKIKFSDLKKKFACVAMDIRTGEKIVFLEGDLAMAIKASVNIPGLFSPIPYGSKQLVDGGVVDFIPIGALKEMGADWIVSSVTEGSINSTPQNPLATLMQVIDIRGSLLSKKSKEESDFLFLPDVSSISTSEFDKSYEAAVKAAEYSYSVLPNLKKEYMVYATEFYLNSLLKEIKK